MCWINWFLTLQDDDTEVITSILSSMNKAIQHRWPDDTWTYVIKKSNHTCALAQVRLSIIDLSASWHQPMIFDKSWWASNEKTKIHTQDTLSIVFNWEIYNYQELKDMLLKKGYVFTTKTDTEVILASYLEWGESCVHHFNWFWAIGIYDSRDQSLFCSRDRLWVKPFYYYCDWQHFIFSSEIKWILSYPNISIVHNDNIDTEAVDFYLTTGYIPAPWTIYKNIKKLEAGHTLHVSSTWWNIVAHTNRWYSIPPYAPIHDKELLIAEWKQLLEESVKIRMFTADVPVGAFLSGWLDSSSVVAEMTKRVEKSKLNTFSVWFEGKYDETPYITIVKEAFATNHHHAYFTESDFEQLLDTISYYYDEPFWDYSNFPTTFVSMQAKKEVTVSLSGDGGDEIFWWYMMHQVAVQMEYIRKIPLFFRKILYTLIPKTGNNLSLVSKLKEALRVSFFPKEMFYAQIGWSTLYKPEIYKQWTTEKMTYLLQKTGGNYVQAIIDFDLLFNTLADNFLTKVDRASMSQALEVRSPFLDRRRIERARKVPTKRKVTLRNTKILMREIIKDIVPESITHREKKWFTPPIDKRILQDTYSKQFSSYLDVLYTNKIISSEWKSFYEKNVLINNNTVYNVYKIKLLLLYKRYQQRMSK